MIRLMFVQWLPFAVMSSFLVGDEDSKRPSRMQQQSLNSELILSKEQLYDMFQQILGIKKFEHQLLFNALQVYGASFKNFVKFYYVNMGKTETFLHIWLHT